MKQLSTLNSLSRKALAKWDQFSTASGQTLIEILVALGIISIVVTALSTVVITSMGNAAFGKYQSLTTQYAQQALETMRSIRDSDYVAFKNKASGTYCLAKSKTTLADLIALSNCATTPNVDNFIRTVAITQSAPICGSSSNVSSVEVSVSWQDSKCPSSNLFCHSSKLSTCLSTVNPVPTL